MRGGELAGGSLAGGNLADGDLAGGDLTDDDLTEGDLNDGDLTDGDLTDDDLADGDLAGGELAGVELASGELYPSLEEDASMILTSRSQSIWAPCRSSCGTSMNFSIISSTWRVTMSPGKAPRIQLWASRTVLRVSAPSWKHPPWPASSNLGSVLVSATRFCR